MAITLDHDTAKQKLTEAFKAKPKKNDANAKTISDILRGSHKTYKYILMTAILAKAADEGVNPLSLQAGAPIEGAYDARSLCHKVFVPFERRFLSNALGGSNEPYLNKPARFTHLSLTNAVRAGGDKVILAKLIGLLTKIRTSSDAREYLSFALKEALKIAKERIGLNTAPKTINPTLLEIYDFIAAFIERSFEGETCVIIVGTLEKIYHISLKEESKVVCHKVNQSGASSKEIGDIDVYVKGRYRYSVEVKDKAFTSDDLEHAFKKVIDNNGVKCAFVFGPRGAYEEGAIQAKLSDFKKRKKFFALFMDVRDYARSILFRLNINDRTFFINKVLETAVEINAKDETRRRVHEVVAGLGWNLPAL